MDGFHSFWTRPMKAQDKKIILRDFEALVAAYSVLKYKENCGKMHLVTDASGAKYLEYLGLLQLYDDVHVILDEIVGIDPDVFWAAGKLYAYEFMKAPCISLDMDAVLYKPFPHKEDVTALHVDNALWDCYSENRAMFASCGMKSRNWDWSLPPLNVGVLQFLDSKVKNFYTSTSISFMECFTNYSSHQSLERKVQSLQRLGRKASIFEQIFAEQRILSLCVGRAGGTFSTVSEIDPKTSHLKKNDYVTHVWGIKSVYRALGDLRRSCVSHLANVLGTNYPEATPLLSRVLAVSKLSNVPFTGDPWNGNFKMECLISDRSSFKGGNRLFKVLEVKGEVYSCDLCFGNPRPLVKDSVVVLGETLLLREKSECVLKVGKKTIQIFVGEGNQSKDGFYSTTVIAV